MLRALKEFRDHVHAAQEHRRELREIGAMDARQLGEIGLTRGELREVATAPPEVTARMEAMARRHGIGHEILQDYPHDYAHLIDSCIHCRHTALCAEYLADETHGPYAAAFCPNHRDYLALRDVG